jgi:hypothetical protein
MTHGRGLSAQLALWRKARRNIDQKQNRRNEKSVSSDSGIEQSQFVYLGLSHLLDKQGGPPALFAVTRNL